MIETRELTDRVRRLRAATLDGKPYVSDERARLVTEFYASGAAERTSTPVARAMAFRHILQHKALHLDPDELIVGERGPAPKATPTYPEICTHTDADFEILHTREKIAFAVPDDVRETYRETIQPFWAGRSIRDRILEAMESDWIEAYRAGVFTEFMEQRAPGHTVLGDVIYSNGLLDLIDRIRLAQAACDPLDDMAAVAKREQWKAMEIAAEALIAHASRYAVAAREHATRDRAHAEHWLAIAEICDRVPAHAPRTLREALQYYWFVHLGVITELNTWDSFNPGRLDKHIWPFYKRDLEAGRLTEEDARELLQTFWVKFNNQPAPPKVGVTAQESNTYTDFCLINLGGMLRDGSDASNPMTFMLLDTIEDMRLLQPSSMVQISRNSPDSVLQRALEIIATGYGQPSLFNTDAIVEELVRQGKSVEDARDGGASGCVEAGAFGREAYILTGYFNLVKVLELTLNNGVDPRTGNRIGLRTGDPASFDSFDDLFAAFRRQLGHFVRIKMRGSLVIERLYASVLPAPFLSLFVDDCIASGRDYNDGGARYNTSYIQGVGIGTITDSLSAIKTRVFDEGDLSMQELVEALASNFEHAPDMLRVLRDETPKYGNDDDYADDVMLQVFEAYFDAVDGRPNTRGGHYRVNLLPTTCHVYFGSVVGATPDGRRAGIPLSEGISPVQGMDRNGPTAAMKSAAKMDHVRTGGTLLNQKFTPSVMGDKAGIRAVGHLVRGYFRMDGHHVQFNVVDADTLREAQMHPEDYGDLIVRVAGYSDYFVDLGEDLQNEIIRRTEHDGT